MGYSGFVRSFWTLVFGISAALLVVCGSVGAQDTVQRCDTPQTKPVWETRCYTGNVTLENYDSLPSIAARVKSTLAWTLVEDLVGLQSDNTSGQFYSAEQIAATTAFLYFGGHLGWAHDVAPLTEDIRQTGPVFAGQGFDTHQRVRLFYSDAVVSWLRNGREGEIPDGAMIVKQMYASNPEDSLYGADRVTGWAVMTRNAQVSKDGWIWYLFFFPNSPPYGAPLPVFYGQAGDSFCLSCHAATDNVNMTFSSLRNLEGAPQAYSLSNNIDPGVFVPPPAPAAQNAASGAARGGGILGSGLAQMQSLGLLPKDQVARLQSAGQTSAFDLIKSGLGDLRTLSDQEKDAHAKKLLNGKLEAAGRKIRQALEAKQGASGTLPYAALIDEVIKDIEAVLGGEGLGQFADQLVELYLRALMEVQTVAPLEDPNQAILDAFSAEAAARLPKSVADLEWYPLDFIFSHTPALPKDLPPEVCKLHKDLSDAGTRSTLLGNLFNDAESLVGATQDCRDVFITSDNCNGCHWSYVLQGNELPHMLVEQAGPAPQNPATTPYWDISPYAEWSGSMMGLAGKDPIFHAQLSWEQAHNGPDMADRISNLCLRCHQPAAQRQFHLDHGDTQNSATVYPYPQEPDRPRFTNAFSRLMPSATIDAQTKWGALGRDGITCTVCHQIEATNLGQPSSFTSQFDFSDTPGVLYGPYPDDEIKTYLMEQAIGLTPEFGAQLKDPALCGSCHTVVTPIVTDPLTETGKFRTTYEQTTYPEWLNSAYASGDGRTTCQDCHMASRTPDQPGGPQQDLSEIIANVETAYLPALDNRAADDKITPTAKAPYRRHVFAGLNLFANQMFQQFPSVLGNSGRNAGGIPTAAAPMLLNEHEMLRQAQEESADIAVASVSGTVFDVTVTNKVGHKFPSGVGFRRAFIRFEAFDAAGELIWSSGRTNAAGQIIGPDGAVLPSEMTRDPLQIPTGEPHISDQSDVYIFEERTATWAEGQKPTDPDAPVNLDEMTLTTSFLEIVTEAKDTRMLPAGWTADGPYAAETRLSVIDRAAKRARPFEPSEPGTRTIRYALPSETGAIARVKATLLYQSIPPYYIRDRLDYDTPEIRDFYYMVAHLKTEGTPVENWAVEMVSAEATP